nr:hypothetical protein [Bradyrhizobium guangzhouense]
MIIALITREAIDVFDNEYVEELCVRGLQHRLKAGPVYRGKAGHGSVLEHERDSKPFAGGGLSAQRYLVFD